MIWIRNKDMFTLCVYPGEILLIDFTRIQLIQSFRSCEEMKDVTHCTCIIEECNFTPSTLGCEKGKTGVK